MSLDASAQALETDLTALTSDVINDAGLCESISAECATTKAMAASLQVLVDYGGLAALLQQAIISVRVAIANDVGGMVDDSLSSYYAVADDIDAAWQQPVDAVLDELSTLNESLTAAADDLIAAVPEVSMASLTDAVAGVQHDVETYGEYWFYASLGLSGVLLLISVCYALALCCGACCRLPSTARTGCCTTRHAARSLTCGAVVTVAFTWLHMLATMALFATGGLTYTEVCRYLSPLTHESPALTVIESLYPHVPSENVTVTSLVEGCENDDSLYQLLGLNSTDYNISQYVDVSGVETALDLLRNVDYVMNVTILSTELNDTLRLVSNGFDSINYTHLYIVLSENITSVNLSDFTAQLERTADSLTIASLADDFRAYAATSDTLYTSRVLPMEADASAVVDDLMYVYNISSGTDLSQFVVDLTRAQSLANSDGGLMVQATVNDTTDDVRDSLLNVTSDVAYAIEHEIGRCGDVYEALAGVVSVTCEQVLDPYNVTWLAQGCTLIVLVPCLVIALTLAPLYRKTVRHGAVQDVTQSVRDDVSESHAHTEDVELDSVTSRETTA